MFIKKCDLKCIKILAKCDTRTEYVYCCHFTITCFWLSCDKRKNAKIPRQCKFKRKNANIKGKTLKFHDNANLKGKTLKSHDIENLMVFVVFCH
jgi:hypothetical protein